jgi:hypothetical protein
MSDGHICDEFQEIKLYTVCTQSTTITRTRTSVLSAKYRQNIRQSPQFKLLKFLARDAAFITCNHFRVALPSEHLSTTVVLLIS